MVTVASLEESSMSKVFWVAYRTRWHPHFPGVDKRYIDHDGNLET
jgi:hypothetical protein